MIQKSYENDKASCYIVPTPIGNMKDMTERGKDVLKMVDAILSMPEYHRFSKGIFSWVGFDTYYIPWESKKSYIKVKNSMKLKLV